jgi:hypothetical protein
MGSLAQEITPHAGNTVDKGQRPVIIGNPESQKKPDDEKNGGATKTGNFCGASFALHCEPNAIAADKHEDARNEREERDIIAQESVAASTSEILWWTRWQLILSALGICGLGWTLFETRRTANAALLANTIAERSHMPFVKVTRVSIEISDRNPSVRIYFKNTGKSPIEYFQYEAVFEIRKRASDGVFPMIRNKKYKMLSLDEKDEYNIGVEINGMSETLNNYRAVSKDFVGKDLGEIGVPVVSITVRFKPFWGNEVESNFLFFTFDHKFENGITEMQIVPVTPINN